MLGSWDDLRFLLATLRHHSFGRAGRALGVNATTVGRRVAALERQLGARLVDRTPDGVRATASGARVAELAEQMEAELALVQRSVVGSHERVEGRVRITAGDGFSPLLVSAAKRLVERHPGLELELAIDPRVLDLTRGEADLALRTVRPAQRSLTAQRLGTLGYGLFASASYLARAGTPSSVAELESHALVGLDEAYARAPEMRWLKARGLERFALRTNSAVALADAAAAGLGIAALARALAARRGELVQVLAREDMPSLAVWLVFRHDERRTPRVRAVADALVTELRAHEGELRGGRGS